MKPLTEPQAQMLMTADWNEYLEAWLLNGAYAHRQVRHALRKRRLIEVRLGGHWVLTPAGVRQYIDLLRARVEKLENALEHEVRQHG